MREVGIRARHKRRFKATADSKHSMPVAANPLARNFTPPAPNQVWTGNIAYIATGEGWLYLAIAPDLLNREAIGWSIKPRISTDIVTDALSTASSRRKPEAGVAFHSDRPVRRPHDARQLVDYGMTASRTNGATALTKRPERRPRLTCSSTSRSFTTGGTATPSCATARRLSSSRLTEQASRSATEGGTRAIGVGSRIRGYLSSPHCLLKADDVSPAKQRRATRSRAVRS